MCNHSKTEKQDDCGCNFTNEIKCRCAEKPDSDEKLKHMKECAAALRKKANDIEQNIKK